jgi:hypothetical protein
VSRGPEDEALEMIGSRGVPMVTGMAGSQGGYWARSRNGTGEVVQHLFWLFESEADARAAESIAVTLREMPEAPAIFLSADVCEIVGVAPAPSQ